MSNTDKSAAVKRGLQIAGFAALFLVSFVVFLFLTFPYEVLKESLAAELSKATGYNIRIGDLSPNLPLGLDAENVRIEPPKGGAALTLRALSAEVSLFGFLLGKVKTDIELEAGSGNIEMDIDFGVFDLIAGVTIPRRFAFKAKSFPLDEAVAFGLASASNSPNANPMVAPLISAIGISAQLGGQAELELDADNPTQSTGEAEIVFNNAVLMLDHPSLGLPNQAFQKAMLKAKVQDGKVVLDKSSGFVSDELELLTEGQITLKPDAFASLLDLTVIFRLNKGLKERFGFLIDAVTGSATSEGQLTMQVRGPMQAPAVTTF